MDSYPTPNLVVDLTIIEKSFKQLREHFPFAKIYYTVKANPKKEAIKFLSSLGTNFDIASTYELDMVLANGGSPGRVSYGNTIKRKMILNILIKKELNFSLLIVNLFKELSLKKPQDLTYFSE